MKLTFAGCSEVGTVRKKNEDAFLMRASEDAGLFLVADGVGSREYGDVASKMLRDRFAQWWDEWCDTTTEMASFSQAAEDIRKTLLDLNEIIVQRFGISTAGTTLVLVFLYRGQCLYLSSGDSRIYRARGMFSFRQITIDDVYETYRDRTDMFEKHSAGKLVGAIGISKQPIYSFRTDRIRSGDCIFLCSDGVYRYVSKSELRVRMLSGGGNPGRIVKKLSLKVEQGGASDNYSMIYIRVQSV